MGNLASLLHSGFSRTPWMALVSDGLGLCPAEEQKSHLKQRKKDSLKTQVAGDQSLEVTNESTLFSKRQVFVRLWFEEFQSSEGPVLRVPSLWQQVAAKLLK